MENQATVEIQEEIVRETVLYEREDAGLHVVAKQVVFNTPIAGKEGEVHQSHRYEVVGTLNGEEIHKAGVKGYRQTIFDGRSTFKELYDKHVRPAVEAEKARKEQEVEEEKARKAKEKEEAKAKREAEKAAKEAEKERKRQEREAEKERKAKEREEAKAAKEAEKARKAAEKAAKEEAAKAAKEEKAAEEAPAQEGPHIQE